MIDDDTHTKRLFFSLDINVQCKQQLSTWLNTHVQIHKAPTQCRNWHLTLCFLGEINASVEAQIVQHAERIRTAPFSVTLDEHDYWQHNGLFHLKPSHPPAQLFDLAAQLQTLANDLAIPTQHHSYKPHVTLARSLKQRPIIMAKPPRISIEANTYTLFHSTRDQHGLVYQALKQFAL